VAKVVIAFKKDGYVSNISATAFLSNPQQKECISIYALFVYAGMITFAF
jgi:hypothetical protein